MVPLSHKDLAKAVIITEAGRALTGISIELKTVGEGEFSVIISLIANVPALRKVT